MRLIVIIVPIRRDSTSWSFWFLERHDIYFSPSWPQDGRRLYLRLMMPQRSILMRYFSLLFHYRRFGLSLLRWYFELLRRRRVSPRPWIRDACKPPSSFHGIIITASQTIWRLALFSLYSGIHATGTPLRPHAVGCCHKHWCRSHYLFILRLIGAFFWCFIRVAEGYLFIHCRDISLRAESFDSTPRYLMMILHCRFLIVSFVTRRCTSIWCIDIFSLRFYI